MENRGSYNDSLESGRRTLDCFGLRKIFSIRTRENSQNVVANQGVAP